MAISVNTIEEYEQAKARGIEFNINATNKPEFFKYVLKDIESNDKDNLAESQGFDQIEENLVYNLNSKFNFGKHKGNQLKYVYKCDPYYVEWCLLNASGVIISPDTINILMKEKVFNIDDLWKYVKIIDEDTIKLDLFSFSLNHNNFPYSNNVNEVFFSFSKRAIQVNLEKLKSKVDTSDFFKGGNWGAKSFIQDKRMRRKSIKIKTMS